MSDVSEADLESAFLEDPMFGLEVLHEAFGQYMLRYIKSIARGLDVNAIEDVYQGTFVELLRKAHDSNFDWRNPMRIVNQIARTNAIDAAKRNGFRLTYCNEEDLPYLARDFNDTRLYTQWKALTPLLRQEFSDTLNEIVDVLPEKQRVVAICFRDQYPDLRERGKWGPIAQAVGEILGTVETTASVKSAWHEAKGKIAEQLRRRGYEFLE